MNMHRLLLLFTVFVIAARTEGAFWQLMAKELHSQCLRMDTAACIGFKLQHATGRGFMNNINDAPEMDRQVDKMLIHNLVDNFSFSHWHTGREVNAKFRTLDSIMDIIIDVATSGYKQYANSKGPNGDSRRRLMFIPILLGIVLKVVSLIPILLGKLAIIGLIAFFVSKLSLAIVAFMSLKKLFQSSGSISYPSAAAQFYGYPYNYYTYPHGYYENTVQNFDYPQLNEHGHYDYHPQAHYGYTPYYSPGSYQGQDVTKGRRKRNLWNSYQDISSSSVGIEAIVPAAASDNGLFGQKEVSSFYTPMKRRRRGIRKLRDLVPLQKEVGIAHRVLNAREGRDDSSGAGQRRPIQASRAREENDHQRVVRCCGTADTRQMEF